MELLLITLCMGPSIGLILYMKKKMSINKPNITLLLKLLIIGSLSVVPCYFMEGAMDFSLSFLVADYYAYNFIYYFICVALVEEAIKFIFLYICANKYDKYFKTFYDGILFSAAVAMGFALTENLVYAFIYTDLSIHNAFMRAITPGHFCFAIIMGLFFSKAKEYSRFDVDSKCKYYVLSVLIPTLIHGLYDWCLSINSDVSIFIFILLIISIFVVAFRIIANKSKEIFFL